MVISPKQTAEKMADLGGERNMERIDLVMDRVLVMAVLCLPFYMVYKFGLLFVG